MSRRTCPGCGVAEDRITDRFGRVRINLDPVSGKCVQCLIAAAFAVKGQPSEPLPVDYKAAQAGERDE